jgi:hypothetical protein
MRHGRKPISRLQAIKYCSTAAERRRRRRRIGEELQKTHEINKKKESFLHKNVCGKAHW